MTIVSKSFLKELQHKYHEINNQNPKDKNVKTVAFFDKKRMIPSKFQGVEDKPFVVKKDNQVIDGKVYKKGDEVYDLYIRIENSKDKFSIYEQKATEQMVQGRGMVHQKEIYNKAYEKYLKLKDNGGKLKEEIEKDKLLRDNLDKEKQIAELRKKLVNTQAEVKKSQELVNAFSDTNKKVKENESIDNISKHRKNNKK